MLHVLLFALLFSLANMAWISDRWLAVIPANQGKRLWQRLAETLLAYFILLALAYGLELQVMGQAWKQGWEFYSITLAMFVVLAFPGFIYRVLWKP